MTEDKLEYTISIKDRNNKYQTARKNLTRVQFDAYYDGVVDKGGKVIGLTTKEIDTN